MKTAEDFFKEYADLIQHEEGDAEYLVDEESFIEAMIEFAKLHVESALKEASNNLKQASGSFNSDYRDQKNSILNSYSLNNIK